MDKRWRIGFIEGDLHFKIAGLPHGLLNVIRGQPDRTIHEGRRTIDLQRPAQRKRHVFGRQRIAGMKAHALANPEGEGLAISGNREAFRKPRQQFSAGLRIINDEKLIIDILQQIAAGDFEGMMRIECDKIINLCGDHQGVARCLLSGRLARAGQGCSSKASGAGGEKGALRYLGKHSDHSGKCWKKSRIRPRLLSIQLTLPATANPV